MKKTIAIIAALAVSFFSVTGFAQDKAFSHLSLGPSIGTDGIGIELGTNLGRQVQMRAGYSFYIPITLKMNLTSLASSFGSGTSRDLSNVPVNFAPLAGGAGNILFDFFPSRNSVFHITAGAFIHGGNVLKAKADLTNVLRKDEYGTLAIGMNKDAMISSDEKGMAYVDAKVWPVMPYVGIGFGRAIHPEKKVSVNFDLGVSIWGSPYVQSYNYVGYVSGFDKEPKAVKLTSAAVNNKDKGLLDVFSSVPVYPTLKLTVFFGVL